MKDYERLTARVEGKVIFAGDLLNTPNYEKAIIDRLAELEDKIENGKLVELPVGWLDALKLLICAAMCYADIDNMIASGMQNSKELADLFMNIPRVQGTTLQWSLQDLANRKLDCNKITGFEEVLNAMPRFKARVEADAEEKLKELKSEK